MEYVYFKTRIGILELIIQDNFLISLKPSNKTVLTTNISLLAEKVIKQVNEYFSGKRKVFDLPLKQEGTKFQQTIWDQLIKIPYGETVSYYDIAKQVNNEKAVRAVGNANGKNNIFIIIPCHRVIGKNGSLTGYAFGTKLKKELLDLEQEFNKTANNIY